MKTSSSKFGNPSRTKNSRSRCISVKTTVGNKKRNPISLTWLSNSRNKNYRNRCQLVRAFLHLGDSVKESGYQSVISLYFLRNIRKNKSENAVNQAIGSFARVLGYDRTILLTLVDLVYSRNAGRVDISLLNLLRLKV